MPESSSSFRFVLTEEQEMLRTTVTQFVKERAPVGRLRSFRDSKDPLGFSRELWKDMAELGWLGLHLPEGHGGLGLGFFDLCVVLEATGRALMPEPFISTLLLGAQALLAGGNEAQKKKWLAEIASGQSLVSVAYDEEERKVPHERSLRARRSADGFHLAGRKAQVLGASSCDLLIVAARAEEREEITLFAVDPEAEGVAITPQQRIDTRPCAIVELDDVPVRQDDILGELHEGGSVLGSVLDRVCIGLAAQMLGAAEQAFDDTLVYLKERVQFDVPIGSFQALQHRAARLYIELSLARSALYAAARCVDDRPEEVAKMASLAKVSASEAFMKVAKEAIQMHGGVGMTDEFDIGFYLKRAQVCVASFGDSAWHRRRWASLSGY